MTICLANAHGIALEIFEGNTDAICEKIGAWIADIQEGDTITFVAVDGAE